MISKGIITIKHYNGDKYKIKSVVVVSIFRMNNWEIDVPMIYSVAIPSVDLHGLNAHTLNGFPVTQM